MNTNEKQIVLMEDIKNTINTQLANADNMNLLVKTTFKGLTPQNMKSAMLEGMLRGFSFENFLRQDVYAVPFGGGYSLVTSIDHARKVAMRSGLCGKSAPLFEYKENGKDLESCSITIKKKESDGYIGEYTATVFFDEYTTGRNLWKSKPKTMIAKVAEMHALRMAFPEESSKMYSPEEMEREIQTVESEDITKRADSLREKSKASMKALSKENDSDEGKEA